MSSKPKYFNVPTKEISSLFFHPEKEKILVASKTGGLLMYQIGTENRPFCFSSSNFSPVRGVIAPKTGHVIGASFEGKIAMWEEHNDKPCVLTQAHSSQINDLDINKQFGSFMTASNDKSIKLWDPNMRFVTSFTGHKSQVLTCACNQVGKVAVSGDQSGTVLLWDQISPGQGLIMEDPPCIKSKGYPITSVDIDATGTFFSVLTARGHLGMFDIRNPTQALIKPFKANPCMAKMHPQKPYILCTGSNNSEMVFNKENNSLLFSFEGHPGQIKCCAWSHNGKRFATADDSGTVIVWNLPKPPKTPTIWLQKDPVDIKPNVPQLFTSLPLDVLAEEVEILADHVEEYNEKLADEEKRILHIIQQYKWGL